MKSTRANLAAYFITKFSSRSKEPAKPFSLGRSIEESSGTLICMPIDDSQFRIARYIFKRVFESDSASRITLIVDSEKSFDLETNARIIRIKESDIGFWRLPKKEWVENSGFSNYDVVLDLNTNFRLHMAYLTRELGTGLRIGFAWQGAESFYNFLVSRSNVETGLEKIYRTIRDEYTNLIPLEQLNLKKSK